MAALVYLFGSLVGACFIEQLGRVRSIGRRDRLEARNLGQDIRYVY